MKYALIKVNWQKKALQVLKVGSEQDMRDLRTKLEDSISKRNYSVSYQLKIYKITA